VVGIAWLLVALALASASAAADPDAYSGAEIRGKVVDAETQAPLAGVFVVARWELTSSIPFQRGYVPLHILETVTDARGEYHFPAWGPKPRPTFWRLWGGDPTLIFFKPGYRYENRISQAERNEEPLRKSDWHGQAVALDPYRGTPEQWADHLSLLQGVLAWGFPLPELPSRTNDNWRHHPRIVIAVLEQRESLARNLRHHVWDLREWDVTEEEVRAAARGKEERP
jgi:hypothetical protein